MFFPRLRRHAKWMFVFLALVFGVGFVVFGVGAGGTGVGDIFRDRRRARRSPSPTRGRDRGATRRTSQAWRDLSTALADGGRDDEAIAALNTRRRAGAEGCGRAPRARRPPPHAGDRAAAGRAARPVRAAFRAPAQGFPVAHRARRAVGRQDPIANAVNAVRASASRRAPGRADSEATHAVDAYKQLVALQPNDPNVQLELAQAAQQTGDAATAIAAYERFLKLAPDDPNASIVRQQLKQLKQDRRRRVWIDSLRVERRRSRGTRRPAPASRSSCSASAPRSVSPLRRHGRLLGGRPATRSAARSCSSGLRLVPHARRRRHDGADRPEPRLRVRPVAHRRARRGHDPAGRARPDRLPGHDARRRARPGCPRTSSPARTRTTSRPTSRRSPASTRAAEPMRPGEPAEAGSRPAGRRTARRSSRPAGCSGCHTLAAAGSNGTVGPNLDDAKPSKELVDRPRHERPGRDAVVQGPAERGADRGVADVRLRERRQVAPAGRREPARPRSTTTCVTGTSKRTRASRRRPARASSSGPADASRRRSRRPGTPEARPRAPGEGRRRRSRRAR